MRTFEYRGVTYTIPPAHRDNPKKHIASIIETVDKYFK